MVACNSRRLLCLFMDIVTRQIRNIKAEYPKAIILEEAFTGTKMNRPKWNKLYAKVDTGDTIVFDSYRE